MTIYCQKPSTGYSSWSGQQSDQPTRIDCSGVWTTNPIELEHAWQANGDYDRTWDCTSQFNFTGDYNQFGTTYAHCTGQIAVGTTAEPASYGGTDTGSGDTTGDTSGETTGQTLQIEGLETLITDFDADVLGVSVFVTLFGLALGWGGRALLNALNRF